MCLQDLQLARATLVETYEISIAALGNGVALPANKSRIGFLVLGPNTGNLGLFVGALSNRRSLGTFTINTVDIGRTVTIYNYGQAIQEQILFSASVALTATIFDYSLPLDPESLQRLAATGKW